MGRGRREQELQKDSNDQDEARAVLCNSIWKDALPFLKAWVRDGKWVQTPAAESLGWLAGPVARKGVLGE